MQTEMSYGMDGPYCPPAGAARCMLKMLTLLECLESWMGGHSQAQLMKVQADMQSPQCMAIEDRSVLSRKPPLPARLHGITTHA